MTSQKTKGLQAVLSSLTIFFKHHIKVKDFWGESDIIRTYLKEINMVGMCEINQRKENWRNHLEL